MSLIEEALKKRQNAQAGAARTPATPAAAAPRATTDTGSHYVRRQFGDPARAKRVDRDALRQAGLLPPESQMREIEHQFRFIKRPLIRQALQEPIIGTTGASSRSILVSSALPGDGKTFTSLNLALSMAMERDHSVVLIDGDVAKPHISRVLGAENEPGLLDCLEDPSLGIESVILPTDVPGFSFVPVGRQSHQATELLASANMRSIIQTLESLDTNCIVVVDSPPILLTSEARVLASLFGQVVLVVRAAGTPRQAVIDAVKLLSEGPKVNLVLNQALHVGESGYYGYGTGYKYGDGAVQESKP